MTATHHGSWFGVTISSSTNFVTILSLQNNALSGNIPTQIGELNSLNQLSLRDNSLSGTIPEQFGELTELTDLYLSGNDLTGPIPNGVCDLPPFFIYADCGNCNPSRDGCCNDCLINVSTVIQQTLLNVIGACATNQSCRNPTINSASNWFTDPDNHPADLGMNEQVWKVSGSRIRNKNQLIILSYNQ